MAFCLLLVFTCSAFIKSRHVIEVDITRQEKVLVNQDYVEIKNLCDRIHHLLFYHNLLANYTRRNDRELRRVVVSIYSDRVVSYKKYMAVNDQIEQAYRHAWNDLAYAKYHLPFHSLKGYQKNDIQKILPKKISEADHPKNK